MIFRFSIMLFAILCFGVKFASAQSDKKAWTVTDSITWDDFKGPVDPTKTFDAWTQSGDTLSYKWRQHDNIVNLTITGYAYISRSQSWVKKSRETDALLSHERMHFNIAEIFFRQFVKTVLTYQFTENLLVKLQVFISRK